MLAYLAAVVVVLVPCLYMLAASSLASRFPSLQNKRICLLIAHPDDEAMFFAPTVLALTRPDTGNHVKILCLSTGMHSTRAGEGRGRPRSPPASGDTGGQAAGRRRIVSLKTPSAMRGFVVQREEKRRKDCLGWWCSVILFATPGDADGLGETRKKELVKSAMLLGLRDEDDVFVVDNQ
jgi:LmbE family N-acetylglucosaminyl deacetylase